MEKSEKGKGCRSWKYQKCDGITWPGKSRDGIINPYFLFYDTYLGYKVVAGLFIYLFICLFIYIFIYLFI